jgi:hypothetical protein
MPLRIGIGSARLRDAEDLFHHFAVFEGNSPQLSPILPFAPVDHIVQGRKRIEPMIQMPVQHGSLPQHIRFAPSQAPKTYHKQFGMLRLF